MGKYEVMVLEILDGELKSTNQILEAVEKKSGKVVNWHVIYRILMDLVKQKKAERVELRAGFFWKKRQE